MTQSIQIKERRRGRPVEAVQQDLKIKILEVAEELFSDLGYSATSIRHIADQAGVNPALVHYYFSNKKTLLQTVMQRALEPLGQAISVMNDASEASVEKIADLLLTMASSNPNIPRLLIREVMLPGGVMQQYFTENLAPQLGGALPALLDREKTAGRMREDADPAISAVLVMSLCVFPFIARTLAEPVLGVEFDKSGIELLHQQITELLRQGMTR